ncbi:MAG: hypothetical protein KGL77_01705 [Actinomycetales bacterium]|nr:hypothetical protein [Actinomycetales bacterium]
MEFDDLFADLEHRFDAMLQASGNQTQTRAIELQLRAGLPRELCGGAGRILMISPHLGTDFVAGIDVTAGTWRAVRLELVRTLRYLTDVELADAAHAENPLVFETATEVSCTDALLADVVSDWLVPMRLAVLLRGESRFIDVRLVSVSRLFVSINQGGALIQLPVANLLAVRADLADFSVCG